MNQAMAPELPAVWFFLLAFTLILFIILDGADLGIGVLSLGAKKQERSVMMDTIGPLWYANETWLVIAGAILFGAFPLAYSLILSSLYIPVMMVLFGLIFRAVSTEFMGHSDRKGLWEIIFGCGSLLAIAGQGFVLGGILSPIKVEGGLFAGGPWDWLNVTSITVTAGIVAAYSMLGASYLVSKSEASQAHHRKLQRICASMALALFILSLVLVFLTRLTALNTWMPPRTAGRRFFSSDHDIWFYHVVSPFQIWRKSQFLIPVEHSGIFGRGRSHRISYLSVLCPVCAYYF